MLYKDSRIPALLPHELNRNLFLVNCISQTTRVPKLKQFQESFIPAAGMLMLVCHIQSFMSKTPLLDQMTFLKYFITFQDIFFLMCTHRTTPNFLSFSRFLPWG